MRKRVLAAMRLRRWRKGSLEGPWACFRRTALERGRLRWSMCLGLEGYMRGPCVFRRIVGIIMCEVRLYKFVGGRARSTCILSYRTTLMTVPINHPTQ